VVAALSPAVNPSSSAPRPVHSTARVLIVEDNVDAARLLEILLRTRAHAVGVAHDGRTALSMVRAEPPAVMLIDLGLPDMTGYELARQVRADESLQSVMLIALTGYGEPAARAMTAAAGFDHHMVKPLDRAELESLLNRISARIAPPPRAFEDVAGLAVSGA
jgi:DNA-binding response OmpR family regulator